MAWPMSGDLETIVSGTTTIKKSWGDGIMSAMNGIYGGTKTLKSLKTDGTGNAASTLAGSGDAEIGGNLDVEGALNVDGASTLVGAATVTGAFTASSTAHVVSTSALDGAVTAGSSIAAAGAISSSGSSVTAHTDLVASVGDMKAGKHLVSTGSTPTVVAGLGQDNPPVNAQVTVNGTDVAGSLTVVAGAGAAANATIAQLTFAGSYAAAPNYALCPSNKVTCNLATQPFISVIDSSHFELIANDTVLANGVSYAWRYTIVGKP